VNSYIPSIIRNANKVADVVFIALFRRFDENAKLVTIACSNERGSYVSFGCSRSRVM